MKTLQVSLPPWKARVLLVLLGMAAFLVPFFVALIVEQTRIKQWGDFGFAPEQTRMWWRNGISFRDEAIRWRSQGFGPDEAAKWKIMEFIAQDAKEWKGAGFDVAGAASACGSRAARVRAVHASVPEVCPTVGSLGKRALPETDSEPSHREPRGNKACCSYG